MKVTKLKKPKKICISPDLNLACWEERGINFKFWEKSKTDEELREEEHKKMMFERECHQYNYTKYCFCDEKGE